MSSIIEVRGVSKRFGENIILDNFSFDISEGSIFGLIGKSGCGKTTLLNLVVGFLKPNKGSIHYRDKNIENFRRIVGRYFGFACQEGSFYKKLTVNENLSYFGKIYGLPNSEIKKRTNVLLDTFGLKDAGQTLGHNLSIGMQKRLDIACALIHDPEVLILDEPTANLDPSLRKNILELIKKINENGTTVIISSHILDDISTLCNKVLFIDDKRVAALDTPENLRAKLSNKEIIELTSDLKDYNTLVGSLLNKKLVEEYEINNGILSLHTKDTKTALKHINQHFGKGNDALASIKILKPSLVDIFESMDKK